jgi:hypothetical protein
MNPNTRTALETAYVAWNSASLAHDAARKSPAPDRRRLERVLESAQTELTQAQQAARAEFANARTWRISKRWLAQVPLKYPVVDHAEFFLTNDGEPAALLTHSYAPWAAIRRFASEHGLSVERLDWSWHYPGGCIAAVFTEPLT